MDQKIVRKTQDTLGKIIKKPPLTEKLLSKPPFRFLHDVVTSVIKTTGFMKGLFTEVELNSENVKDKDSKMAFLQKAIDFTSSVTGKSVSAKPSKIVAGHEPDRTNDFLQCLAAAINVKGDYDAQVNKFLNKGSKEEPVKDKEKSKDRDDRRKKEPEEKRDQEKSRDRERGREKEDKKDSDDRKDKSRDRDERHRDRDDRHKDRDERHRDRDERHKDRDRRKKHRDDDDEGKENEGMVNGERPEPEVQRPVRPSSAKGSRRRREEDEVHQQPPKAQPPPPASEPMGDDDLPPQVAASRKMNRPSSARPAPPRRKQETIENEPAMRLGSGKPANVIVDGGDSDDDENFLVEESAPPPPDADQTTMRMDDSDEDDHGGLVKKILETKKELEGGSQQQQQQTTKKTEVERPTVSDAQRRKQRDMVQKEIDKLRGSIQTLTRSANPLGKIMDYVQEDLDSMQKELERWKTENQQHVLALKREKGITDKAIEPMKVQLGEVDQAIADQMDLIAAVKSNILRNDAKIEKLLRSIAKS